MSSTRPPPQMPLDLDLTIISAKHLKNVNWKNGDLKPYAVFWVDPDRGSATKSDDSGSTRPVWNERFSLPLYDAVLTLRSSTQNPPKPPNLSSPPSGSHSTTSPTRIRTYTLTRSSGRPQGKIRVKIGIRERPMPDYHISPPLPPPQIYYYTAAPSLRLLLHVTADHSRIYRRILRNHHLHKPCHTARARIPDTTPDITPPPPLNDQLVAVGRPSAPVDYKQQQKPKSRNILGLGAGLAVGAVAGV